MCSLWLTDAFVALKDKVNLVRRITIGIRYGCN